MINELVNYTGYSYEFRTRVNAIASLRKLNYFDEKLMANLVNAIPSANRRLSTPAGEALAFYYSQSKFKKQIDDFVSTQKLEEWQKNKVMNYLK